MISLVYTLLHGHFNKKNDLSTLKDFPNEMQKCRDF